MFMFMFMLCSCTQNKSANPQAVRSAAVEALVRGRGEGGGSVWVAHAEAEQYEAAHHACHRPDSEDAQVVHADARHVEPTEGAGAVARQPVARLVCVAKLEEDVIPESGDGGVLRAVRGRGRLGLGLGLGLG